MHGPFDPSLYAIIDLGPDGPDVRMEEVCQAVTGGVTLLQLRGKGVAPRRLWILARELVRHLGPFGIPLLVNDRADVARAAGAQGVHLGQSDMPATLIRRAWPEAIIGVSVHNQAELELARNAGASYVASGSLFPTATKSDATPLAAGTFRALAAGSDRPIVAIGGITVDNAVTAARLGASGIAVISGLWSAPDVAKRARELRAAFESGRG